MVTVQDMTTGPITGHFRQLAVPAAVGMIFSTLYNVIDVWFAGLLNTASQAGMAVAFQIFFILVTVGFGLSAAMSALLGNALGARDRPGASRLAAQGISYGLMGSLLLMGMGYWGGPCIVAFLSAPGPYQDAAIGYLHLLLLATPGFVLAFGINGMLQAQGDTKSMQYAMAAAFFVNIGLNPLLMYGIGGLWHGMGLDGIAMATVLSQSGVMVFLLFRLLRSDLGRHISTADLIPTATKLASITAQLAPTTFAMSVLTIAGFVVQYYMKSFGTSAVAAYGLALRIEQLFLLPALAVTGSLLPIAAQNYGAGAHDRVRQALFDCWRIGLIYLAIACPVLWLGAAQLIGIFTDDASAIASGVGYLRVDGLLLPAYMMLFAVNSFLQALKRPIWTLWIGLYRQAFGVATYVWVFVHCLGTGVTGVWYGIATSVVTGLMLSLWVADKVTRPLIGGLFGPDKR